MVLLHTSVGGPQNLGQKRLVYATSRLVAVGQKHLKVLRNA